MTLTLTHFVKVINVLGDTPLLDWRLIFMTCSHSFKKIKDIQVVLERAIKPDGWMPLGE